MFITNELNDSDMTCSMGVLYPFTAIFYDLDEVGLLNLNNDLDIFPLHYVYIPLRNKKLEQFQNT